MRHANHGYALLAVLVLLMLLGGLTSLILRANVRQLRDNRQRALSLQERADQLHLTPAEN